MELPKIGKIRWVKHRPFQGTPKSVTMTRESGMYFVSVLCEVEIDPAAAPAPLVDAIAYDYGVNKNYALSDGTVFDVPGESEGEKRRRLKLEQHIGRCEEVRKEREADARKAGTLAVRQRLPQSRRELRAREALRRLDGRLCRRAHDALHKFTTRTVRHAALIGFEDLNIKGMTASAKGTVEEPGKNVAQKSGLNRGLLQGRPGTARMQVQYKSVSYGRRAVAVPPAFTSQYCSKCGCHPKDDPSTKHLPQGRDGSHFQCTLCGFEANADWNASRNIEREARQLALLSPEKPAKPRRKNPMHVRGMRPGRTGKNNVVKPIVGGHPMTARGALADTTLRKQSGGQAVNREVCSTVSSAA